jgi:hypothetical protein
VITGAIVGSAERRGCGAARQQLVMNGLVLVAVLVSYAVGPSLFPESRAFAFSAAPMPAICMLAWGFLNFWMTFFTGRAMARGPNGLSWTIAQSGLVFPFLMGLATGQTAPTWTGAAGFLLILANVVASGIGRDASAGAPRAGAPARRWFPPALAAFFLCGANQCAANLVSYLPPDARPQTLERMFWGLVGATAGWVLWAIGRRLLGAPRETGVAAKYAFLLKVCGLALPLQFSVSVWFLFRSLDLLQEAGLAAIASPMQVNACLIGFFLYGRLVLRERTTALRTIAFALGVLGVFLIALG